MFLHIKPSRDLFKTLYIVLYGEFSIDSCAFSVK